MTAFGIGKRFLLPLMIAGICLASADLFGQSSRSKLTIMVKARTDDDKQVEDFDVDTDSSATETRVTTEMETAKLYIQVKNKYEKPVTCQLEWYFFTENTPEYDAEDEGSPDETASIFDAGKKEITIEGNGGMIEESPESKPFVFKVTDKLVDNFRSGTEKHTVMTGGDVYDGYVVLLTKGGRIITQTAKPSKYLKEEWIKKIQEYSSGK
jgi:hypothetical protein